MALALITLGRGMSFGILFIARSIFSFTSMNSRSMSVPGSKESVMLPASILDWVSMSFSPATCDSCWRMGFTICCSTSSTEEPGLGIWTVMRGMSTSGIKDTGI